jgi:hypothetical protein
MERLGLKMPSDFTVKANFYTEIGKAVHYVAQNALARTGRLWGYWKCANPNCSNPHPKKWFHTEPSFMPECCEHCGCKNHEYEEIRLEDPDVGLRGHTDGIIVRKTRSSILEVKTAGKEKIEQLRASDPEQLALLFQTESPFYGYGHQAATYATLARWAFPQIPPVTSVDFLFFNREEPTLTASVTLQVPDDRWYREVRARIVMAQYALREQIIPIGFATSKTDVDVLPSCRWCLHKAVCLEPQGKVRFEADALYDQQSEEALHKIMTRERAMGTIIRGDITEQTDVLSAEDKKKQEEAKKKAEAAKDKAD